MSSGLSAADASSRRAYWSSQMDQAAAFMDAAAAVPVVDDGQPMVSLTQAAADAGVQVLFSDTPYNTGHQRVFALRQGLVPGFLGAAREMNHRGWVMKVEDGYRSVDMQTHVGRQPGVFDFILRKTIWELDGQMPTAEFFLKRYRALVALTPKVGTHTSGSAIDISVYDQTTGQEIDRGGPYLEVSELTPMASPFISPQAQANRQAIVDIMHRHGLYAYPFEFWHFSGQDAYEPLLTPHGQALHAPIHWPGPGHNPVLIPDPLTSLQTPALIDQLIQQARQRLPNL